MAFDFLHLIYVCHWWEALLIEDEWIHLKVIVLCFWLVQGEEIFFRDVNFWATFYLLAQFSKIISFWAFRVSLGGRRLNYLHQLSPVSGTSSMSKRPREEEESSSMVTDTEPPPEETIRPPISKKLRIIQRVGPEVREPVTQKPVGQ